MRWGRASIPELCVFVQCGRWAYPIVWTVVALLDGGLRFFLFVRAPIVDGTVCVVWWSVKFVFRIVDGTGMFSVSS